MVSLNQLSVPVRNISYSSFGKTEMEKKHLKMFRNNQYIGKTLSFMIKLRKSEIWIVVKSSFSWRKHLMF